MHLSRLCCGVAASALQLANLFGQAVALSLQRLKFGNGFAAASIQISEVAKQGSRVSVARAKRVFYGGQIGPHKG